MPRPFLYVKHCTYHPVKNKCNKTHKFCCLFSRELNGTQPTELVPTDSHTARAFVVTVIRSVTSEIRDRRQFILKALGLVKLQNLSIALKQRHPDSIATDPSVLNGAILAECQEESNRVKPIFHIN